MSPSLHFLIIISLHTLSLFLSPSSSFAKTKFYSLEFLLEWSDQQDGEEGKCRAAAIGKAGRAGSAYGRSAAHTCSGRGRSGLEEGKNEKEKRESEKVEKVEKGKEGKTKTDGA
jgi:hypothetical protein